MKNIVRVTFITAMLILVFSSVSFAQTAANNSWSSFWTKFSTAIKNKNRVAIKSLADSDFFDGGGGDTVTQWMRNTIDKNNAWGDLYNSVRSGTKNYSSGDGKPWRVTKDNSLLFIYKNKRWQFHGVMGD